MDANDALQQPVPGLNYNNNNNGLPMAMTANADKELAFVVAGAFDTNVHAMGEGGARGEGGGGNVTGMNENGNYGPGGGGGGLRETGEIVNVNNKQLRIHDNYENWGSKDINSWLELELKHAKFDQDTIDGFMNQFREIDMTGMILQAWLKDSNGDKDALLTRLQTKIDWRPKSMVWDVVIQVMMNL